MTSLAAAHPDELLSRQVELERDDSLWRARRGLLSFTCYTKPDYEVNWHHRVLCRALNAFVQGRIRRLMISMPPRAGKSELVSRQLPAFMLGLDPNLEIIAASYGATLAERMNRDVQRVMSSREYREVFPNTRLFDKNVRTVADGSYLRNSETFEVVGHRGRYLCAGVGGPLTGHGADKAIIDDPTKNWQDAQSKLVRDRHWEWYSSVLYTRLSKNAGICLCNTRWHSDDLQGRLIAQAEADPKADQWVVINLPAIAEKGPSPMDPRQIGEALWPSRFPLERLQAIRKNNERVFVSLYQGRPSPPDGDVVKRVWWKRYRRAELPDRFDTMGLSADLTFSDKEKNDYNVLQVWGRHQANFYLLHQVRARMSFTQQLEAFGALCQTYPQLRAKWVENAANGAALIDVVKKRIPGVIAVTPKGSKLARAEAIAPLIQAGNVWLPRSEDAPWVEAFLEEWTSFPNGTFDDQCDAASQGLAQLSKARSSAFSLPDLRKSSLWQ